MAAHKGLSTLFWLVHVHGTSTATSLRTESNANASVVGYSYSVILNTHCGGGSIYTWANGEAANYGQGFVNDIPGCKTMCDSHADCAGFVQRDTDNRCSFWKSAPLSYVSPGTYYHHHCYEKGAAIATSSPTPGPTPSPTPSPSMPSTAPSAGGAGGAAAATGDPHLQNIHGERFDLMRPGRHVLINIPRRELAEKALLRVEADAQRIGGQCTDMYFQAVNVTGVWAGASAKLAGGLRYNAQDASGKQAPWRRFGPVQLKIAHGRTRQGTKYLNLHVKGLGRAGFAVGGLLGEDDHSQEQVPPEECHHSMAM